MSPGISVIIPTYNRASMVTEAVASVLVQQMADFEVIVVDDGSSDETEKCIKKYGQSIRYHRQSHAGVSAARNRGLELSRAPLIAFLDSDDLWLPEKLHIQEQYMAAHPQILICQTEEIWWRNGRRVNPKVRHQKPSGDIFRKSLDLCLVSPSTVMTRRELFNDVGCFDEELPVAEDYDLWLRVAVDYPVPLISKQLVVKRGGHPDQLSATASIDRYRIKALEKLLSSGRLLPKQYEWTWQALRSKCGIYGQGCLKRGRIQEGERYLVLPEKYRHKA